MRCHSWLVARLATDCTKFWDRYAQVLLRSSTNYTDGQPTGSAVFLTTRKGIKEE